MRRELQSAVDFLTDLLAKKVALKKSESFRQLFYRLLVSHYEDHWFPEKPYKGSAYRCIRINHKMDPIVAKAGIGCGLTESDLFDLLPNEFTMWVDPREVSYRIGEEGSIGVIFMGDATDNSCEASSVSSNNQNNNMAQEGLQRGQCDQERQLQQQQQHNSDFFRSCKDQLRYILPDSTAESTMNLEYLSSFVAS